MSSLRIFCVISLLLYMTDDAVTQSTTTAAPNPFRDQCLRLIELYTLQRKEFKIPSACRKFEQVQSVTAESLLTKIKQTDIGREIIHQNIRHPSFPVNQIDSLVPLLVIAKSDIKPKVLTITTEALLEKKNNFQVPKVLTLDKINFLGDLVMFLPGYFVSRLSHKAFDFMIDKIENYTKANPSKRPIDLITEEILNDPSRHEGLCIRAFSLTKSIISSHLKKYFFLMTCAPGSVCASLSLSAIEQNWPLLSTVPWDQSCSFGSLSKEKQNSLKRSNLRVLLKKGSGCAREMSRKLSGKMKNATNWNDVKKLGPFMNCMSNDDIKQSLKTVDCSQVKAGLLAMTHSKPEMALKQITKRCITPLLSASTVTCTQLKGYKEFLTSLPMTFLKSVQNSVLCDTSCQKAMFENFGGTLHMPSYKKHFIMKKCALDGALDDAAVERLGGMVVKLPIEKVKSVSVTAFKSILTKVKEAIEHDMTGDPRKKTVLRSIAKKFLDAGSVIDIADNKEFMKQISLKDLRSVQDVSTFYNKTVDLSDAQNKFFMKKVLKTKQISNMTADDIGQIKSLAKGLNSEDISKFNPEQRMDIAVTLCEQTNWPLKSIRAINRKLIVESLKGKGTSNPMAILSAMDVDNLGCECLLYFKPEEIKAMEYEACQATCTAIGACNRFQCLNPKHRTGVLDACLACMNLTSGRLSVEDVSLLGPNLLHQFKPSEFNEKVDSNIINSILSYFQGGCLSMEFQNVLRSKILIGMGLPSTFNLAVFDELLEMIMIFNEDERNSMNMEGLNQVVEKIVAVVNPTEDTDIQKQRCCERWMSEEDKVALKAKVNSLYSTVMKAKRTDISSSSSRKKRATVSWTCSDIQTVGQAFTESSIAELEAISATEFSNCITHLGSLSGWSSSQLVTLLNRTETTLANSCEMDGDNIVDIGSIAISFSLTDIKCLNLTSDDAVSALGSFSHWSKEQLIGLANRFEINKNVSLSSMTSDELTRLGHILCGYDVSKLNDINATMLSAIGSQLGALSSLACDINHVQALTTLLLQASSYGHSSTWDAAVISELGLLVAGLPGDNLAKMTISALEGMSTSAIALFPAEVLTELSIGHLKSFSSAQAMAVTQMQRYAMSVDQRNGLAIAAYGEFAPFESSSPSGTDSTSAETVQIALSIIMGLLCLCLFYPV